MDAELKQDIKDIKQHLERLNGRVRTVENWKWMMMGGLTILSIIVVPIVLILIEKSL